MLATELFKPLPITGYSDTDDDEGEEKIDTGLDEEDEESDTKTDDDDEIDEFDDEEL